MTIVQGGGATPGRHARTPYSETVTTAPTYSPGQEPTPGWQRATSRRPMRAVVVAGVALLGFVLCALSLASSYGAAFGVQVTLLAVLLALIPLAVVIPTFLWLDRFEAEPNAYLVGAFLWGALVAALLAGKFNTSALLVFEATTDHESALAATAVFVAPFVEEGLKGLLVFLVWRLMRREFDGVTDGMVYAGITAAGFAFTENISYLAQAYLDNGTSMLTATFVLRCIMSPFAHPMFTVLTGIGIGMAATSTRPWVRWVAPVVGYLCAVTAHALWNLSAMVAGTSLVGIYLIVDVPIFLAFVALVVWARRREGRIIGQFLTPYAAAGWLSPSEVAMLSSMPRRREARVWARTNAGRQGLTAMRGFQDAASELALLRRRMYHSAVDARALTQERLLLHALVERRRDFVGLPVAGT